MTGAPSPTDAPAGSGAAPSTTTTTPKYPGAPLWVKLGALVLLVVILVFGALHLAGRGMGPMDHMSQIGHTAPTSGR
jgi:hypothetical protein